MKYVLCILFCYLIGSFSPSYFIGKMKGINIKESGSKNAGASNAAVTMGRGVGILVFFIDCFKAILSVRLSMYLFDGELIFPVAATSVILGHIFPFYMNFNGGKGAACFVGVILSMFSLDAVLFYIVVAIIDLFVINYVSLIAVTFSITFPFYYYFVFRNLTGALILTVLPVVIVLKHIENFRNIYNGVEFHFTYLFNKEKEEKRVKANIEKLKAKLEKEKAEH